MNAADKKVWTAPKLDRVPMSSTAQEIPEPDFCDFFPQVPDCQAGS